MENQFTSSYIQGIGAMTEARWKEIAKCKKEFISGQCKDPITCQALNPIIAASWKRCRDNQVNPFATLSDLSVYYSHQKQEKLTAIDEELKMLSEPLFNIFDQWTPVQRFDLTLDSVLSNCQLLKNHSFASQSKWDISGSIQEETVIGTNAYALVKLLQHPVSVQGPEYYNQEFEDCFVAAAPIFDPNHQLVAVLQLAMTGLKAMHAPWGDEIQLLFSQLLGLCSSIATAIEKKLHLSIAKQELESANILQETMLSLIEYGIVVINTEGKILHSNKAADRYLMRDGEEKNNNFFSYLYSDTQFLSYLEKGESFDWEDTLYVGKFSEKFLIQVRPLKRQIELEGFVLSLQPAAKADQRFVLRVGNQATITFQDIIGHSPVFQKTLRKAELYAHLDENVLLCGESGTGKELFAQAIHNRSHPNGPFIALNCAAIPRNLIESELFGYEKGSFTGASKEGRPGKIELAQNGTLFLDEIGDMPLELQAVLLRVLENKQVSRIGGIESRSVNFRLISATNKDLKKMAENHQFRQDLYYRLSVLTIQIPPLREREDDIMTLSSYFIERQSKKIGCPRPTIPTETKNILSNYYWPGNVRQLENTIISCMYAIQGDALLPEDLPSDLIDAISYGQDSSVNESTQNYRTVNPNSGRSLKEMEKEMIRQTLLENRYHMSKTAQILGISLSTLYRKIKEYDMFK